MKILWYRRQHFLPGIAHQAFLGRGPHRRQKNLVGSRNIWIHAGRRWAELCTRPRKLGAQDCGSARRLEQRMKGREHDFGTSFLLMKGFPAGSAVKNPKLPRQEMQVQSLGQEDPRDKETATHSRILAWDIPWREETGKL